jgi:hypothetical protein
MPQQPSANTVWEKGNQPLTITKATNKTIIGMRMEEEEEGEGAVDIRMLL